MQIHACSLENLCRRADEQWEVRCRQLPIGFQAKYVEIKQSYTNMIHIIQKTLPSLTSRPDPSTARAAGRT